MWPQVQVVLSILAKTMTINLAKQLGRNWSWKWHQVQYNFPTFLIQPRPVSTKCGVCWGGTIECTL